MRLPAMPVGTAAPGTPQRPRRQLAKNFSDPKADVSRSRLVKKSRAPSKADLDAEPEPKRARARLAHDELLDVAAQLNQHGVPEEGQRRLLPLLEQVGPARMAQVLGLWTFLGDGGARPPAAASLQVWGPAGSGKTEVVSGFLRTLGIRHVHLNVASLTSSGELLARLTEELRRIALAKVEMFGGRDAATKEVLKTLQNRLPAGRQIRALDRLEVALKTPMEHLGGSVAVVLDNSQQLPRLGHRTDELLLELPEVLRHAGRLVFVFVGRLPLSSLGVPAAREPPAVAFSAYSTAEVTKVLAGSLLRFVTTRLPVVPGVSGSDARNACDVCTRALMQFAVPCMGTNLQDLLRIGEEMLRAGGAAALVNASTGHLGQQVERLLQQRLGVCDLSGLLEQGQGAEGVAVAPAAMVRRMVKTEKRLLVAAYLASKLHKDNDVQHFMPAGRGRQCRRSAVVRHQVQDGPASLQEPRSAPLARVLAIYHRLAQQPQALGPLLLEQLVGLHEAGLVRFAGDRPVAADREARVTCRAELQVASACAADLGLVLAEYGLQH